MPGNASPEYPWYTVVAGTEIEQGDILLGCPRLIIQAQAITEPGKAKVEVEAVDAIILTQSCDLAIRADGRCEAEDVMLCPVTQKKDLATHKVFQHGERWDEVRKGRQAYFHVLNACQLPNLLLDFMLIDFHHLYALNSELVRHFATNQGPRPRLAPPYREHLSQAFARLFMRVGLPTDIPAFGRKK
jgi:hypothetical protein